MEKYIKEIIKRKDLLIYLVKSGLKAENRNSYLGYFWWLLDPLLNAMVYYFLVIVILGRYADVPEYPVYLVIGLVVWRWMNTTVNTSAKAIIKYSSIINQVNLPKVIFPFSLTLTQLFNFSFGLIVIGLFLIIFQIIPGWQVVFLPFIIIVQLIFLLSVSLFIAYICVFIRDIDNILTHILRLFFYASPIIWIGSRLPDKFIFNLIVTINPVAIILDAYRAVLMYQSTPNFVGLLIIGSISLCFIYFMLYYYSRNEHKIIKAL